MSHHERFDGSSDGTPEVSPAASAPVSEARSRRAILMGAIGAVVGAGLGVLGRGTPALGAAGDPVIAGRVTSAGTTGTTLFASATSPTLSTFNFGAGDALYSVAADADQEAVSAISRAARSGLGAAVRGEGGLNAGVVGTSTGIGRSGIVGQHAGSGGTAVLGQSTAESGAGVGVRGTAAGDTGTGVHGAATRPNGRTHGVIGEAASNGGIGVLGRSTAARTRDELAVGVRGESAAFVGVWGETAAGEGTGVVGNARVSGDVDATGVLGETRARAGAGTEGVARSTTGVAYGVYGGSGSSSGIGVRGTAQATNGNTYGVYADVDSPNGLAIFGRGSARVTGDMTVHGQVVAAAGRFRIDHPSRTSRTQTLSHGFVGSDQWKTFYDGTATLNGAGEAVVTLPSWFGRLNRDARIQLTPVGAPATLFVAQKVSGNTFRIGGGAPGQEVFWQVTGVRRDRWAEAHPLRVEETKRGKEADRLLHPDERGVAPSRGVTEAYRLPRRRRRLR